MRTELDQQYEDLTGQVKKLSLHKLSCNKNMDYDLNFLVKQFEEFAKHNKLVGSPIDRLFNQKIDFQVPIDPIELTDSPSALKLREEFTSNNVVDLGAFSSGVEPVKAEIRSLPFVKN